MYYAYLIENTVNDKVYIGITKDIPRRWRSHKHTYKKDKSNAHLYNAMRKYGLDKFTIREVATFECLEDCCKYEIDKIQYFRSNNIGNYNMHSGGTIGYDVSKSINITAWKEKLRARRKGRKPALGMKHTEDNKKLFSEASRAYWNTQDTYNQEAITKSSFKEAKELFGISKTHYYRIKKRLSTNDT